MSGSCCGPRGCGPPGKTDSPCYDPSTKKEDAGRFPPPRAQHAIDASKWRRAANAKDQFASYGSAPLAATPPYENDYTYTGEYLASCQFPLGGFGCGQVTLSGDGTLNGWTCLNQGHVPERQHLANMPANFFAVAATPQGGKQQAFMLATPQNYTAENQALPTHAEASVAPSQVKRMQGLPGVKSLSLQGKYPIANVDYEIDGFPVQVSLEATSPLIPGDPVSSAIPAAVFTFTVKNSGATPVAVRLMEAQQNFVGWNGSGDCTGPTPFWGGNVNAPFSSADGSHAGVYMTNPAVIGTDAAAGNISVAAVSTQGSTVTVIPACDNETDLFSKFEANAGVSPSSAPASPPSASGASYCAGAVHSVTVAAGATATVQFVLSWYFPNRMRDACVGGSYADILPPVLGNRYATFYTDAKDAARYLISKAEGLLGTTRLYTDTVFSTTIPPTVLDSAAGRLACWRSATMWWTKDGIVMGCEGNRCCPLNCSHVYGYTTLLERMYPTLAQDMAYSSFVRNYIAGTGVSMRFKHGGWAIDGALASVIKAYMCVRQADPDGKWLESVWPNIKDQMTIIMTKFDVDGDGCIRCPQQNTYDTSMNGANTFIGSYYITSLRAASAMAKIVGDSDFASKASARAALAAKSYDAICWKEEFGYFIADVTLKNCAHSYGPGCFVDQVCAAGLSCASGLGYLFANPKHEQSARLAIAKNNKMTMPPFKDMQKHFYPGDSGITVCTYPNGKLGNGMQYDNLVSAGFTSPVIAGLIFDNTAESLAAALDVVGYIRNRQDGRTASPWNEPECNILYSRSMAHWNLFDQACGQSYDATRGYLAFAPRWNAQQFKCFVTVGTGWGQYTQTGNAGLTSGTATLKAQYGTIELQVLNLPFNATKATATLDGSPVSATYSHGALMFASKLVIQTGSTLTVTLGSSHVTCAIPAACAPGCCPEDERQRCLAAAAAGGSCCGGGPTELRQRCCQSKAEEAAKSSKGCCGGGPCGTETLQDEPGVQVAVLLPGGERTYAGAGLIFIIGILIGLYMPAILRFFGEHVGKALPGLQ